MERSPELLPHGEFGRGAKYYHEPPTTVEQRRSCTDCLFVVVFLAVYGLLGVVGFQVIANGNMQIFESFAHGKNAQGQRCGVDEAVKDFPLTYFTVPDGTPASTTSVPLTLVPQLRPVCTKACPSVRGDGEAVAAYARADAANCQEQAMCTWYGPKSTRIANYCIDVNVLTNGSAASLETFFADLKASIGFIITMFCLSVVIGFAWLLLIRLCAKMFIWLTLLGGIALFAIGGYLIFTNTEKVGNYINASENTVRITAYVVWGLDVLLVLTVVCSVRSIAIAASILKTAALFLADVKSAMLLPLVSAFFQLGALLIFSVLVANAASMGVKEFTNPTEQGTCVFDDGLLDPFCIEFDSDNHSRVVLTVFFLLLMYFWSASLLHAFNTFTVAYAAGIWYFATYDGENVKMLPGGNTFCDFRLLCNGFLAGLKQVGSLAMGSLIMAICKMLVLICKWAKKKEGATNPVMKCIFSALTCLAVCLDRTCRLVTDNAYIQMALSGKGFCTSCCIGLGVIVRNPMIASCVSGCSRLFSLLGPLAVMSLTGLTSWIILGGKYVSRDSIPTWLISQPLTNIFAPMMAVLFLALLVGLLVMNPYSVVSTTIMQAFVADKEMDEHSGLDPNVYGHGIRPHTPTPLQGFVRDHCH